MRDDLELEEVERALSVLDGRHPEKVKAERLEAQAIATRLSEHRAAVARERARSRRRLAASLVALAVLGAAGFGGYRVYSTHAALEAEIAPAVARYVALGFDALPHGTFARQERVEIATNPGDCYALVAARDAAIRVEGVTAAPRGEALLCTCTSSSLVATTDGAPLRALHIAGGVLGGTRSAAYRFEKLPPIVGDDSACADDMLAAFAQSGPHTPDKGAAAPPALARSGFLPVATTPARLPYTFIDAPASRCFIALGDELDVLSVATRERSPVAKGALAWCSVKAGTFVVERHAHSAGNVSVFSAPSARIGGVLGLREAAARAGLQLVIWQRDEDRAELACDTLRASVVPDPVADGAQSIDAALAKTARVLVFSAAQEDHFTTTDLDVRCDPVLRDPEALCVQARAASWHAPVVDGPPTVFAAWGPLPYWMTVLSDVTDPRVIDPELALMTLSRRLGALGYTPVIIEGVTEKASTVEVLGRSGEDAIIAIGLYPGAPFAHPYGPPWKLGGEPSVIPLAPGAQIALDVGPGRAFPPATRRTVVFRRPL